MALLAMLLLITFFCVHTLGNAIKKFLLPFVFSMVIISIVEQPAEFFYLTFTGRIRWSVACPKLGRRLRRLFTTGEFADDDTAWYESDTLEEASPILAWRGRHPRLSDTTDAVARGFTVIFTMAIGLALIVVLALCLIQAGVAIKEDWPIYKEGAEDLADVLTNATNDLFNGINEVTGGALQDVANSTRAVHSNSTNGTEGGVKGVVNSLGQHGIDSIERMVVELLAAVTSGITNGFMFGVQVILYMFFWLLEPLPVGGGAAKLVRSYIRKKFIVSVGYSLSVLILLFCTKVKLKAFIVTFAFFLSFIPEIGPLIAALLPVPVIAFDSSLPNPLVTLIVVLAAELLLKIFWGNFVEVRLVQNDEELKIHPVWIIMGLFYFGFSFGPLGMLVSVPIIALVKACAMDRSLGIPDHIAEPFVACVEGRRYRGRSSSSPPEGGGSDVESEQRA